MKKVLIFAIALLLCISIVLAVEWAYPVSYKIGDEVTYQGKTYRCIQAHTSQAGWTPLAVPALWQEITSTTSTTTTTGGSTTTTTINTVNWGINVYYPIGKQVSYNTIDYVCRQAHTSQGDWTPDITPALWLRDITSTQETTLKSKLLSKYGAQIGNNDIQSISVSAKYVIYTVTLKDKITGIESQKTWIMKE
jgi:hypothetical protein